MDYIYHYTTLSSLVSIISKQQLRLMRLDKFLNLYENFPIIFKDSWGLNKKMKNMYISSWINDSGESLSKWKLFSNLEDGVRIGINTRKIFGDLGTCEIGSIIPYADFGIISASFRVKEPANRMRVSSEINLIEKQKVTQIVNTDFHELLKADRENLSKQYELIESLLTASIDPISSQNEVRLQIEMTVPCYPNKKRECEKYEQDLRNDDFIDYILVSLPDNFFEDIEILVSPNFSDENLMLLQSFMSKQGYGVQIQKSTLTHLYKFYLSKQSLLHNTRK